MLFINDKYGIAGPHLTQFIIDHILGPVVLLLEPQSTHVCTLYFPRRFKSGLTTRTSWCLLRIEHRGSRFNMCPNPTSMISTFGPEISPREISPDSSLNVVGWGTCCHRMQFGGLFTASFSNFQIQVLDMLHEDRSHEVLGHQMGCVVLARAFDQWHHLLCALLLEP